jgi:thymidylate synthase (FAD)
MSDNLIEVLNHGYVEVLDHGYVRLIETWGHGDAGVPEAGIIEAARQSTQGSFRGWESRIAEPHEPCGGCNGLGKVDDRGFKLVGQPFFDSKPCPKCGGDGLKREPGDKALLRYLYTSKPQHATPFEFAGCVIEVQAPIFVFREWHRHRTQSYNEMSARYAPLPDINYVPSVERIMLGAQATTNKQAGAVKGAAELTEATARTFRDELDAAYRAAEDIYQTYLGLGVPKELARAVLPIGRYSQMRASANLRNWLAFMTLRADPNAQWEIQQFAHAVGDILAAHFPQTWTLFEETRR